jgi:hypothetical protein
MQDDSDNFTFRKWNSEKIDVGFKESTDADLEDETCANPICCYVGLLLSSLFSDSFEETVDFVTDSEDPKERFFTSQKDLVTKLGLMHRPLGFVALVFAFYLMCAPIITSLYALPMAGWLLSKFIETLAAFLFAIVIATTVTLLIIASAWLRIRPLLAVPLFLVVSLSIYFISLYPWPDSNE